MSAAAPSPARSVWGLALIALTMTGVLASLGVWQLERRAEKHALIAALGARIHAEPVALPPRAEWPALTPARDEFRRVRFEAVVAPLPDAMVYTSGSALRTDVSGTGAWAFVAARPAGGGLVAVNAGFVPNRMQDRAEQDRAVAPLLTGDPVTLTGYLRFPEKPGLFTPAPNARQRIWFARDVPAMAAALGWDDAAPFYIDLEAPVPAGGVPKPGALGVHLKDDHLQYAVTWFGLAAVVAIAFAVWLARGRRGA